MTGLFLLVLSFLLPAAALADAIGNVSVADGDTLEIRGTRMRLTLRHRRPGERPALPVEWQGLPVWLAGRRLG
jgi:hypothetical protein